MSDFDLLIDFHRKQNRQGPGSRMETEKAIQLTGLDKSKELKIADIGCGSGGQTLVLAQHLKGQITAVDLFPEFLEELASRAQAQGFGSRISTLACSMDKLPFEDEEYDLLWSEGAIYNMGFAKGVRVWRRHLKKGGWIAVSDITWTTSSRPAELEEFWKEQCPDIDTAENKLDVLKKNGYSPIAHFFLPASAWTDHYYKPLEQTYPEFLSRHAHSQEAAKLVDEYKEEVLFYDKYAAYYSYGFYIARKI